MNPTRRSIWDNPKFIEFTQEWGDFYPVSRQLIERLGQVLVTPAANYLDIATRWTQALLKIYSNQETTQDALEKAALDIEKLVH